MNDLAKILADNERRRSALTDTCWENVAAFARADDAPAVIDALCEEVACLRRVIDGVRAALGLPPWGEEE